MRPQFQTLMIAAAVTLAAALSSPGFAIAQTPSGPIRISTQPRPVNDNAGRQLDAHVSGRVVSYSNFNERGYIHYEDLDVPSLLDLAIPHGDTESDFSSDVFGNIIVFVRTTGFTSPIMFYDIAKPGAGVRELSPDPGTFRMQPSIGGNTVAFEQYPSAFPGNPKICVSSLSDPFAPATCLTDDSQRNREPAVSPDGNVVTFMRCPTISGPACDIYVAQRDLTGAWGPPQQITEAEGEDLSPATNGALVTWTSNADGAFHIYYANVDGTAVRQLNLTDSPGSRENDPSISGDLIAFERRLAGSTFADIFIYQVSTNTLYQLTDTPAIDERSPDISVGADGVVWVVWSQRGQLDFDVWAASFTLPGAYDVEAAFNQGQSHKLGRVVPIRVRLLDTSGANVSSPSLVLAAAALEQKDSTAAPTLVEDAGNSNPDSTFRYDAALQGYVFNLSTSNLSPGTWELKFTVTGDTHLYGITFDVR